jgi:hypothetical protein
METTIHIELSDFSAKAPYSSDQWASTDRGWIFAVRGDRQDGYYGEDYVTLGHYLDYEPCGYARPAVHAHSCVTRQSKHFETPTEARLWILEQAKGQVAKHFAQEAQSRGVYQHQVEEIARFPVDESVQFPMPV